MKRYCRVLFQASLLATLAGAAQACSPLTYSAKPVHGWVIDAERRQPIQGAVVVARWTTYDPWRNGSVLFQVLDAVTDTNGAFALPGWGPKSCPTYASFDYEAPRILVFKQGYVPGDFYNMYPKSRFTDSSEWDGKQLPLKLFAGNKEERYHQLLNSVLDVCEGNEPWVHPALYDEVLKEAPSLDSKRAEDLRSHAHECLESNVGDLGGGGP